MPNHIHGIIFIVDNCRGNRRVGAHSRAPLLIYHSDEEGKKQVYGRDSQKIGMGCIRRECKDENLDIKALQAGGQSRNILVK